MRRGAVHPESYGASSRIGAGILPRSFSGGEPWIGEHKTSPRFLDQVAECFDNGIAVWHGSPFRDPLSGQPITAGELLESIRLGKYAEESRG